MGGPAQPWAGIRPNCLPGVEPERRPERTRRSSLTRSGSLIGMWRVALAEVWKTTRMLRRRRRRIDSTCPLTIAPVLGRDDVGEVIGRGRVEEAVVCCLDDVCLLRPGHAERVRSDEAVHRALRAACGPRVSQWVAPAAPHAAVIPAAVSAEPIWPVAARPHAVARIDQRSAERGGRGLGAPAEPEAPTAPAMQAAPPAVLAALATRGGGCEASRPPRVLLRPRRNPHA